MSPSAKHLIFANLAKYVRTGMGIEKACESLLSQPGVRSDERRLYQSIQRGVSSGQTIADAMSASSKIDPLDYKMLDASEKGGRLESGLAHLSDYYQRLDRTRRRIRKGLLYPVILFHFALIVTTCTAAMFSRFNPKNEGKSFLEAVWESGQWVLYLYLIFVLFAILLWLLIKRSRHSPLADTWLNRIPLLGKVRRFASLERFSSVFEIFLLSGRKMDESLQSASEASESGLIRHAAKEGVKSVQQGNLLAGSLLKNSRAFPNEFARGIAAAEESGMLDEEFGRWKQFYGESLGEAMEQLGEWIPKLVYFTTIFVVAWMIIRVGMSYADLINGYLDGF